MAQNRPRILVAGFQHETNTFVPKITTFAEFEDGGGWPPLTTGAEVTEIFRPLNIPLGGMIAALEEGAEVIPVLWANAEPSGLVADTAFDRIAGMILDAVREAGPLDGICLDLHGAMVTESHADGEAELLRRIRAETGPLLPLAVSLDLHANISPDLVAHADAIAIYRTYPHLDMDETGARAAALLMRMIAQDMRPASAFRQAGALIPLSAQCTDFGPLAALYGSLSGPGTGIWSADIALGFPLADIPEAGPSLVVYADDRDTADATADTLITALNTAAGSLGNVLHSPRDAVREALALTAGGGTVVLADVQDNSGAGAFSNTAGLLRALVEERATGAALGVLWHPDAADAAHAAGAGGVIETTFGAGTGDAITAIARVVAVSDGVFTCTGAMQRDVVTDIGPSARLLLEPGGVEVIVSSRRHQCIDQQAFRHLGIDPAQRRIVAVKSTVHFRADFAPIARAVLNVEAPGLSVCRPERLDYRHLRPAMIPHP